MGAGLSAENFCLGCRFFEYRVKNFIQRWADQGIFSGKYETGAAFTNEFDKMNSLSFAIDVNKLLVPTPETGESTGNTRGVVVVTDSGSNESVIGAVFSSFTDAPGGFKEELEEYTISIGAEYLYNQLFALRTGYFNESQNKGNRKYFTAGAGVKLKVCSIDFSYLIPVRQNNPLANTIRFTISFSPDSFGKGTNQAKKGKR